jgi:hypothetical protein
MTLNNYTVDNMSELLAHLVEGGANSNWLACSQDGMTYFLKRFSNACRASIGLGEVVSRSTVVRGA